MQAALRFPASAFGIIAIALWRGNLCGEKYAYHRSKTRRRAFAAMIDLAYQAGFCAIVLAL